MSLPAEKTRYTPQQYLAREWKGEEWLLREFSRLEDVVPMAAIGCEAPLRAMYAKLEFPKEAPSGEGELVSSPQT